MACLVLAVLLTTHNAAAFPLSGAAWSDAQWEAHCQSVRTSYNPNGPLMKDSLSLTAEDPRFLDFLYWVWANKIIEHQVEQVGGTEWRGTSRRRHFSLGSRLTMGDPYQHVA